MLLVLRIFNIEKPTPRVIQSVLAIASGTAFTTMAAPNLSVPGLLFIWLSSFAEAGRLVLTQNLLVNCKFSVLEGQYFLAPVASASLLGLAAVLELPKALAASGGTATAMNEMEGQVNTPVAPGTAHLFVAACVLGVVVNYLGYMVIQEVGSLSFKLLGTVRNVGLVAWGALFMDEQLTANQYAGYGVSLAGFVAYTHFQPSKSQALRPEAASPHEEEGAPSDAHYANKGTSEIPRKDTVNRSSSAASLANRAINFGETGLVC
jgi:drug/metabolite transporter (DMT)-like permease